MHLLYAGISCIQTIADDTVLDYDDEVAGDAGAAAVTESKYVCQISLALAVRFGAARASKRVSF